MLTAVDLQGRLLCPRKQEKAVFSCCGLLFMSFQSTVTKGSSAGWARRESPAPQRSTGSAPARLCWCLAMNPGTTRGGSLQRCRGPSAGTDLSSGHRCLQKQVTQLRGRLAAPNLPLHLPWCYSSPQPALGLALLASLSEKLVYCKRLLLGMACSQPCLGVCGTLWPELPLSLHPLLLPKPTLAVNICGVLESGKKKN